MRAGASAALLLLGAVVARAERLPLRAYGTVEGLPSTDVRRILTDSRGLLWFSTRDGVARFDGTRFVVYGTEHGLPVPTVNHVIEARGGGYWVATNGGGVCRLDPDAPFAFAAGANASLFRCQPVSGDRLSSLVNVLLEDRAGRLWAASDGGLLVREGDGPFVPVDLGLRPPLRPDVYTLAEDGKGDVWVGTINGLFRVRGPGSVRRCALPRGRDHVNDLLRDAQGRLWLGTSDGVVRLDPRDGSFIEIGQGLPHRRVWRLLQAHDGRMWAGTQGGGLARLDGEVWTAYQRRHGLAHDNINALGEDAAGNLWIATNAATMKLEREGMLAYDEAESPGADPVFALYTGDSGEIYAVSGQWRISRFDGQRFRSVHLHPPAAEPDFAAQAAFRDSGGGWWSLSSVGLGRLPRVARFEELDGLKAERAFTRAAGMPGDRVYRVFEDRRGDLWIGGDMPVGTSGIVRWERASGRIVPYPQVHVRDGDDMPNAMAEDAGGGLWVGFIRGGLGRLRDGRFALFSPEQGAPEGTVTAFHLDAGGRLWIGSNSDGLTRVDDPSAATPRFARYSTAQGLASNNVRCVTSDTWGRIYAGTVRGVDRLDPATGGVRSYTTSDGLPAAFVLAALRDQRGDLWFGTRSGLARLTPEKPGRVPSAPEAWIGGVRMAGVIHPVSHLGSRALAGVLVAPDQNQVQIDFFAIGAGTDDRVRFQHRLEGASDWSPPTEERAVHFSRLAPGRHRFEVRTLTAEGAMGETPATVEFTVLPTLWQRGPVHAGAVALLGLLLYAAHRYRLRHALALERVRTRIASDLHDDIGANLSQIAILSELARRQPGNGSPAVAESLDQIASLSRDSVDSMGDIVWATNPRRDSLRELSQRMRQHATEVLGARGIPFRFDAPDADAHLDADLRRQVFLVFKESVSNLARHSECSSAEIALARKEGGLVLRVADDGRGLEDRGAAEGHGLVSMAQRARELGGTLEIAPGAAGGTVVTLKAPLKPPSRWHPYADA